MTNVFVDGMYICYRTLHKNVVDYFTEKGNYGVIYQAYKTFVKLEDFFEPDCIIIVWDGLDRKKLKRYSIDNNYKATRSSSQELKEKVDFYKQITELKRIISFLGVEQFQSEEHEADDLLFTLAYKHKGENNFVVAWDKDLYQILSYANLYNFNKITTKEDFEKRFGIAPEEWAYIQAITGDSIDTVKGIKGIGTTSALKLYKQLGWNGVLNALSPKEKETVEQAYKLVLLENNCDLEKAKIPASKNYEAVNEIFSAFGILNF